MRASAAAGPTGEPGDAGGRVGVAFVGVCSTVVPSRRSACARMAGGTAVGWGADYEWFVMLRSPTSALTPPRIIARAPPGLHMMRHLALRCHLVQMHLAADV